MAFDAKQAVIDKLTELDDKLKQAKAKETREAKQNAAEVADIEAEIDGWQKLLAGAEPEPKPAAKKTASKK